jgi:hypothetical protein
MLLRTGKTPSGAEIAGHIRRLHRRIETHWPDKGGSAEHIYDTLYCARGQAENLIKLHKAQMKSDRTSCRSSRSTACFLSPAPATSNSLGNWTVT